MPAQPLSYLSDDDVERIADAVARRLRPAPEPGSLRERRERAGVTQRELARRLGVSAMYVSDVEAGKRRLTPDLAAGYDREAPA